MPLFAPAASALTNRVSASTTDRLNQHTQTPRQTDRKTDGKHSSQHAACQYTPAQMLAANRPLASFAHSFVLLFFEQTAPIPSPPLSLDYTVSHEKQTDT
mmetsp:Transcript_5772/g.13805  ORF Transcript_5772/g.13805 Transcript_5772/m.13805 type:complete len:100 (+) Transcript_5772:830-1129(+)